MMGFCLDRVCEDLECTAAVTVNTCVINLQILENIIPLQPSTTYGT